MARFLVLNHADVCDLLSFAEAVDAMEQAFAALGEGKCHQPLRTVAPVPGQQAVLALMPGYVGTEPPALGVKTLAVFPGNTEIGLETHQGAVLLFSPHTGELQALLNAGALTSRRTAAASALATRYLARPGERSLAIIGAGVQGRAHLQAMRVVRPIRRAVIMDRVRERAEAMAAEAAGTCDFPVEVVDTVQQALAVSDLVVTTSSSPEPIVQWEWVRPGTHINAVGASRPPEQELDAETVAGASLFTDVKESLCSEASEYHAAIQKGLIAGPEHIKAELADLVLDRHPGRTSDDEVTLFRSLGLAIEDLAAGAYVFHKALEQGCGCWAEV